ncbi:MAG: MATE family efflux transporter [Clostridia bacterium]|nr:MATE family efflux transporter [Clostridia bacterium]
MAKMLTKGNPLKLMILFTLPVFLGSLFQQLYSFTDTLIVGQTLGLQKVASVGGTGSITMLVLSFTNGLASGFGVITAQMYGAQNEAQVKKSFGAGLFLCAIISVIATVLSSILCMPLLKLMRTDPTLIEDAYAYMSVIFYGLTACLFYNYFAAVLRALGDSRTPLYFLIVSTFLNIGLDLLFILVFHLGIRGAAVATVLSQGLSAVLCYFYSVKKFPVLRLSKSDFQFGKGFLWLHVKTGLPMSFQFSLISIGLIIMQSALNVLGPLYVSAYVVAGKVDGLATLVIQGLAPAASNYMAQNYGAGDYKRIKQGSASILLIGVVCCAISAIIMFCFGRPLMNIFITDVTPDQLQQVLDLGMQYLHVQASFGLFLMLVIVLRNTIQGLGYSGFTMVGGLLELAMRAFAAFVLTPMFGYTGLCYSNIAAWIGAVAVFVPVYFIVMHIVKKRLSYSKPIPAPQE